MGREKAAVEGLIGEGWFELTEWRMHNFLLSAEGVITARGARYPVRLSYPDQFPHVPAWVEPLDEKTRWSAHQHGEGGSLCLERRPDNWHPDVTGADLLKSAFYLLDVENPEGEGEKGEVASGHNVGPLQSYDWAGQPVLLGFGFLGRLLTDSAEGVASLRWGTRDGVTPVLIFDNVDRSRRGGIPGGELGSLRLERPVIVAKADGPEDTPATRAELAEALGCDLTIPSYEGPVLVVAVTPRSLTIYDLPDQTTVRERRWIPLPDDEGLRSGRSPESAGKRVAIVGLGSVGSKIAEILVRSGVHNIVLIDGDVVLPANLERHALDWRDVGFRKANAMRRRLLEIAPSATIEVFPVNLNWQRSAKAQAEQVDKIAGCDLIVNATGEPGTALFLGAIADANGKPFISASVFEGGLGCLVARAIPGKDPAYGLARQRYEAFCEEANVKPPTSGSRRYEALAEDGSPLVADDAAVTMCASHAARIVLDVLDDRVGKNDQPWLLIGFKEGWLFKRHAESIALDVGPSADPRPLVEDAEASAFALSLFKDAVNALKATG